MTISIRQRLTLWYTAAATCLLAVMAVSLILVHDRIALARLTTDVRRINDAVATVLANEMIEKGHAHAAAEEALIEVVVPGRHLAIASSDGRILAQRWKLDAPPPMALGETREVITTLSSGATAIARALPPVPDGFVVVAAASWGELAADRADLVQTLAILMPFALVVTAMGAWWVAGRALRPAAIMAAEARRFTDHALGQRLTIGRQDELGQLASAFNGLVERLESALAARSRFLADASHELRTPVSIARTAADVTLGREGRTEAEYREALQVIARQMGHLGRIVSDLLILARSDTIDWPLEIDDFNLDDLIGTTRRAMADMARASRVELRIACPGDVSIRGDEVLLHQMLVNLVENAIRHSPPGGTVTVTVAQRGERVVFAVEDTGHGIPEAERERIFERFVRVSSQASPAPDAAGTPNGGTGLGLAIARRIARAHRGDLTLESSSPAGTRFAVTLPAGGIL